MYSDPSGHWIETVFDLISLGTSIVEVVINPADPLAWAGLAGDALDLIPFVTGVGETIKGVCVVAKNADLIDAGTQSVKIVKATDRAIDFTDAGIDLVRGLDKTVDGFTISKHTIGTKIHNNFMDNGKYLREARLRVDGIEVAQKLVFELKPYNRRGLKRGVVQLVNYQKALKGLYQKNFDMFLVLY